MSRMLDFESKQEKYIFFSIIALLFILISVVAYPVVEAYVTQSSFKDSSFKDSSFKGDSLKEYNTGPTGPIESGSDKESSDKESKSPEEFYNMFQCSCCGQPIDADCCGMSKQRKEYMDTLLLKGLDEKDILYMMVKKFGFDVLMDRSKEQEVREYIKNIAPENPPEISIENPRYDFGTIKQSEGVVTTLFNIKNKGSGNLIIDNLDTSCMCTSASLIYKGEEGPRFGMSMHGTNPEDYSLIIPPGDSAMLKVYYDPMAHGKQKKPELKITREVTIISNDPVNFQKKVKIELIQVL